jgi:hypothetical protein
MLFVGYSTGLPTNLGASIFGEGAAYLVVDLSACIRPFSTDSFDLLSILRSWNVVDDRDLLTSIACIEPRNLIAAIRAEREGFDQFYSAIHGWYQGHRYLDVTIQPYVEEHLGARLTAILPRNLSAYIKTWPYRNLQTNIYGWADVNLLAILAGRKQVVKGQKDLISIIGGYHPVELAATIRAFHSNNSITLLSSIVPQHIFDLNVSIKYLYRDYISLICSLTGVPIYLLNASIVGWAQRNLSVTLTAHIPPWYLPAVITAYGGYKDLKSNILCNLGTKIIRDLCTTISGWNYINLLSSISSISYVSLLATLTISGGMKDLNANIKVKEVIFSEFYKFSTVNTADLRAYIGFSSGTLRTPRSAYASLLSVLQAIPAYDLGATIAGFKIMFSGSSSLGILINYTNKYSMLSKFLSFKMSTSVSEVININPAFFKDSLNITFKIINGQTDLYASIIGQPYNASLSATIRSKLLIIHGTGSDKVLIEELVEIERYRRIWSEFIDVYLEAKYPIYYSGGHVFPNEYSEPIMSISFKRASTRGTQFTYSLDHDIYFSSTDAAISYGFSKISGRANITNLSAIIQPVVKNLKLNAKIYGKEKIPLYLTSPFTYLKSGSLSFMSDDILYKSRSSMFGGIQDMTSSISAKLN